MGASANPVSPNPGVGQANYLVHSADGDIQALTINDTTFLCNRTKTVAMSSTTSPTNPDTHSAFVELKQIVPRRSYGLNIFDTNTATPEKTARVVSIANPSFNDTCGTLDCVVNITKAGSVIHTDAATGIVVRVTCTGMPYVGDQDRTNANSNSPLLHVSYFVTYTVTIDLLHGGNWIGQETSFVVTLEGVNHQVNIDQIVTSNYRTDIARVRPTPIDVDNNNTLDAAGILSSVKAQLNGVTSKIIGNGIYITRSGAFNVEALDKDLFNIVTDTVNDVTNLPSTCKHGMIVKVTNSAQLTEDDYYLKFIGENNKDGIGHWEECAGPGIETTFNSTTLP